MVRLSSSDDCWGSASIELSMSFDMLRDYQWKRLTDAIWQNENVAGPYEKRYIPAKPTPALIEPRQPEPTATFSQFGTIQLSEGTTVGIEVIITRSLFECASVLVPLKMFEDVSETTPDHPTVRHVESALRQLAESIYDMVVFDIAALGINRDCQLIMELVSDADSRDALLKTGNFLARDDTIAALRLEPRAFEEVKPALRWVPPKT